MKKIGLICLLWFTSFTVLAEPLGRLFSTPAQRSNLEYLRQTKKNISATEAPRPRESGTFAAEPVPESIELQGYVVRHDGHAGTVWINGQALPESSANDEVAVGKLPAMGNRVPIKIPLNGKQLTLKAGQVYHTENNRISEARDHAAQGDVGRIDDAALQ